MRDGVEKTGHACARDTPPRTLPPMESWLRSETRYAGKLVTLRTGDVQLDDGSEAFREVIEHNGGVGVVPCLGESVVLIRQFRVAIGKEILEIPAGKLEGDEPPEHRAHAELEEEAGYQAGRLISAGGIYPSVGFLTERIHLFLAFDLTQTAQRLEPDERIDIVEVPLPEIRRMLRENALEDAKTIVGLHALLHHLDA